MKKAVVGLSILLSISMVTMGCNTTAFPSLPYGTSVTEENHDYEEYAEKIKPGFLSVLLRQSWTNPEDIEPDSLCAFYCYAILYLEENPSGWDDSLELPSEEVLNGLSRFFDGVTEEQIKKSSDYIADRDVFNFRYGFGGAVSPQVTYVQNVGGKTIISYDAMAGDEKAGEGIVTVDEANSSFKYLSNEYTGSDQ